VAIILIPAVITSVGFGPALGTITAFGVLVALLMEWWRSTRPSTPMRGAPSAAGFQFLLTSGGAVAGGRRGPWRPGLAIPVMGLACGFRRAVAFTGLVVAAVVAVAAWLIAGWAGTAGQFPVWYRGLGATALTVALAIVGLTMQSAE